MERPPLFSGTPLTNKAARRRLAFQVPLALALAGLAAFLGLTAVELWMPHTAARLARWGLLPPPSAPRALPDAAAPAPPPSPRVVRAAGDPRLSDPAGRPLHSVTGRFDPQSPMDVLIPGEAVNTGLKVKQDARRKDRLSGAGAPRLDGEAPAPAPSTAWEADARRRELERRFRVGLLVFAGTAAFAFLGSGFLTAYLREELGERKAPPDRP